MILYCRDNSDIHIRIEELEITNKRLTEDNAKLKKHVCGNSILIWKHPVTDILRNSESHPIVSECIQNSSVRFLRTFIYIRNPLFAILKPSILRVINSHENSKYRFLSLIPIGIVSSVLLT